MYRHNIHNFLGQFGFILIFLSILTFWIYFIKFLFDIKHKNTERIFSALCFYKVG